MRHRIRWFLTSLLVVLGILFNGITPMTGPVAASNATLPITPDTGRDGDDSPSLRPLALEPRVFLPVLFCDWPPRPDAPLLEGPEDVLPVSSDYTLIWSLPVTSEPATSYMIEESKSADFSQATSYATGGTSRAFTDKMGNFYYRVRGFLDGVPGPWSNVALVSSSMLNDSFSQPLVSWAPRRTSYPDMSEVWFKYREGGLAETMVHSKFDYAIFSPLVSAPPTPYKIRMSTRILFEVNLVSYGIVWGGNEGTRCDLVLNDATDPNGCLFHHYRLNVVFGGTYWQYNVKRTDYHEGDSGYGEGVTLVDWHNLSERGWDPSDWHLWEVHVYENYFEIWVNGVLLHTVYDSTYIGEPYYGIFSSTNEYNNAHFEHDYFVVEPIE